MSDRVFNVLFLCTHNSARSILAESILNRLGWGKFRAFSAGSHPKGQINPHAIALLKRLDYDVSGLRSKSWDEFAAEGAPTMDFVFTVCDDAANEVCPVWPGQPLTAHWGLADPSGIEGTDIEKHLAFSQTYRMLAQRIGVFVSLPVGSLERVALKRKLNEIGRMSEVPESSE
jgi:arsenate reductase (thioredoxin)